MTFAISSKSKLDESDEYESSLEEEELERELADVSFEELQRARSNGFHSVHRMSNGEKKVGRANKNRPMEISIKKHVGWYREVIQAPKEVIRDPRFESLCGTLDPDERFRKRYSFLYETGLPAEKEVMLLKLIDTSIVKKSYKYWTNSSRHGHQAILAEHKKKERERQRCRANARIIFKKSEIRERQLVEKYNRLKTAGKLESFIEKRRRKNASKDHRFVPYPRSANNNE